MPQSYYDIDAILAEEELVPCTTLFEFAHLAGLDPDGIHDRQMHPQNEDDYGESSSSSGYLPENSRIKIPLWAVEKWATLGFVRLQLPRHYGRRARERYDADPGDANLRCVVG
jgi:GINS complex subunit 3